MSNLKYYTCDKCQFGSYYVQNYNQHLKSKKHLGIDVKKKNINAINVIKNLIHGVLGINIKNAIFQINIHI